MAQKTPWLLQKFYDTDGVTPLAGGLVFSYEAGTSTKKDTLVSESGEANTNPIELDANGQAEIWMESGAYKFVSAPSTDTDPPASPIDTWDDVNSSGGGAGDGSHGIVSTIAELKGLEEAAFETVQVLGYNVAGDNGAGLFRWNSTSTTTDNGGTIIAATSDDDNTGRWYRVYTEELNIGWFGAVGDGVTDDTTSITNSITFAASNDGDLYVPDGIYLITSIITVSVGCKLIMGKQASFTAGSAIDIVFEDATATDTSGFECGLHEAFSNSVEVTFGLGSVDTTYPQWWGAVGDGTTDDSPSILKCFNQVRESGRGTVSFPKSDYIVSYGFLIPPNCNVYLNGSTFTATTDFGQSAPPTNGSANIFFGLTGSATSVTLTEDYENVFIDGGGAIIDGNELNQSGTPTGTTGLSIEPTGGLALEANFLRVKNIIVKDITFTYFVRYGCRMEGCQNVLLENCRFLYSGTNGLSVIGGRDITMRHVECSRTRGPYINDSNFGCGFWHEPNETWQTMENIVHENCFASYNYRAGFRLINPGQDTDAEIYARGCKSYRNSWDTATDDYWAVNDNAGFHVWIESSYTSNYHIEISDCTALEEYQSGFKVQRRAGEQTNSLVRLKNVSAIHCIKVDGDNYETAAISIVGTTTPTQAARVEIDCPTIIAEPTNTLGFLLGVSYSQDVYINNPRYSGPATYNGIYANVPATRFTSGVPRMSIDVSADEKTSGINGDITQFYKPIRLASVDTTTEPTEFYSNELMVWQNDNDVLTGIYYNDDTTKKYIPMFDSIPGENQIIRGNTDGDGFSVSQATVDQPGNIQAGSNGDISTVGERFLNAYGVGTPSDTDYERANLNHDGANAILDSKSGGTGTDRDWLIQKGGTTVLSIDSSGVILGASGPKIYYGSGTPEGAVIAPIGSTFHRTDGGAGTSFYVKESGAGNTGWVGK